MLIIRPKNNGGSAPIHCKSKLGSKHQYRWNPSCHHFWGFYFLNTTEAPNLVYKKEKQEYRNTRSRYSVCKHGITSLETPVKVLVTTSDICTPPEGRGDKERRHPPESVNFFQFFNVNLLFAHVYSRKHFSIPSQFRISRKKTGDHYL